MSVRGIVRRLALLGLLVCARESALAAPETHPERFRLLSADNAPALERRLQAAAGEGYRILASSEGVALDGKRLMVVLLVLAPDGRSFDYAVPSFSGDFGDDPGGDRVNSLGASGYHLDPGNVLVRPVADFWLPDSSYDDQIVLVMEKGGRDGSFAYDAMVFTGFDRFTSGLAERRQVGFNPIALLNSARRLRILFEKTPAGERGGSCELLIGAKNKGTKMRLNRAARQGYRIRSAVDPSINTPPMFLLEQIAAPEEQLEYDFLRKPAEKIRSDKLERKLNQKAAQGFRVVPEGSTPTRVALARTRDRGHRWEYRTLSSVDDPGLQLTLDQTTSAGFRFVSMFLVSGEIVVLVERSLAGGTSSL